MLSYIDCLKKQLSISNLIRRFFLSWLIAVLIEYCTLPANFRDLETLECLSQMSMLRMIGYTGLVLTLLWAFSGLLKTQTWERWGILAVFTALCVVAYIATPTFLLLLASLVIIAVLGVYGFYGLNDRPVQKVSTEKAARGYFWGTIGCAVMFFLFVSIWTVSRVYSLSAPCYDFGIFSQMFYYMKETGLPMTTVERGRLLSHFAVHFSPIYYLLLPFYCIFPKPATLQILQALILASAVIPLWKLGKHYGLNGVQRMLICAVLFVFPAYSAGASYDIHENCFLTPLLLWLFYGIARKNTVMISVAAMLTLTVKEDAAVYVAVIALWLIAKTVLYPKARNTRELLTGIALLVASVAWFLCVTAYLANKGDGVMVNRYENYMYDGSSSLFTVIKSVLINPMKVLHECVDSEKTKFIVLTMLPLLGLPLLTRRYERYILLIPYILINLMSDYPYQHDIFYQYCFGSLTFLIYLTIVNLSDLKHSRLQSFVLVAMVAIGAAFLVKTVMPEAVQYSAQAVRKYEYFQSVRETLDDIPEEATVAATSNYAAYLSQRKELYDIHYSSWEYVLTMDYVVLDPEAQYEYAQYASPGKENGYATLVSLLERKGYSKIITGDDKLVIYCSSP